MFGGHGRSKGRETLVVRQQSSDITVEIMSAAVEDGTRDFSRGFSAPGHAVNIRMTSCVLPCLGVRSPDVVELVLTSQYILIMLVIKLSLNIYIR
jgi:hypothetical protein